MSLIYDALARSQNEQRPGLPGPPASPPVPAVPPAPPPASPPEAVVPPTVPPALAPLPVEASAAPEPAPTALRAGLRDTNPSLFPTAGPGLNTWLLPGAIVLAAVVIGGGLIYGRREARLATPPVATAAPATGSDETISDLLDDHATLSAAIDAPVIDGDAEPETPATGPAAADAPLVANGGPDTASASMNDGPPLDSPVTRATTDSVQMTMPTRPSRVIETTTRATQQALPPAPRPARAPTQGPEADTETPTPAPARPATDISTNGSEPELAPLDPALVRDALAAADRDDDSPAAPLPPPVVAVTARTPPVLALRSVPPTTYQPPNGGPAIARVPASRIPGFQVHSYDASGARRFIIISGARVREGDYLPDGGRITSITPDGAVLQRGAEKVLVETPH